MPRRKKQLRTLEQIALDEGVEPGAFVLARFARNKAIVEEARRACDDGNTVAGMTMEQARAWLAKEEHDLAAQELQLMDYFHGRKKAVEHSGAGGGPVAVRFILKGL